MLFSAPFRLGPFIVDADGRLCPGMPDQFPAFHITWRGLVVRARLTATDPDGGTLTLQTIFGRVPSTGAAEGTGAAPRQAAFATVRTLPETLPPGWTVDLLPDHRIRAQAQVHLQLPTAAESLVSALALFVLRLSPYLDLLAEGVGIEPAASGSLKTCPG